jgi:hypothetical protein
MNNQTSFKKLTLHRETLRTLGSSELDGVHGGKDTGTLSGGLAALAKRLYDDTVFRPGKDKPGYDDTVYRGGGKIIPV